MDAAASSPSSTMEPQGDLHDGDLFMDYLTRGDQDQTHHQHRHDQALPVPEQSLSPVGTATTPEPKHKV